MAAFKNMKQSIEGESSTDNNMQEKAQKNFSLFCSE